jgi:hypothetical protein
MVDNATLQLARVSAAAVTTPSGQDPDPTRLNLNLAYSCTHTIMTLQDFIAALAEVDGGHITDEVSSVLKPDSTRRNP